MLPKRRLSHAKGYLELGMLAAAAVNTFEFGGAAHDFDRRPIRLLRFARAVPDTGTVAAASRYKAHALALVVRYQLRDGRLFEQPRHAHAIGDRPGVFEIGQGASAHSGLRAYLKNAEPSDGACCPEL